MPREIKKKILDKELSGTTPSLESGDRVEGPGGGMEAMALPVSGPPRSGDPMQASSASSQGGKKLDSGFEFSLDDFDPPGEAEDLAGPDRQELAQNDEQPPKAFDGEQRTGTLAAKAHPRKIAFFTAVCILPIILGFLAFQHWRSQSNTPRQTVVTKLKRPIVVPHFKETLEFLVMTSQENERSLLLINLEFGFSNEERHTRFMEETVFVRDLIFNFLAAQHPSRNSEGEWMKIVGSELVGYMKSATPQCRADAIRLSRLTKL